MTTIDAPDQPAALARLPGWATPLRLQAAGVGAATTGAHALYALLAAPNILPVSDAGGYRLLGRHLAEGHGYVRPYDLALGGVVRPTAEFPPGFPSVLGVLHAVGLESVRAQRLALAILGGLTAVLVLLLARRFVSPVAAVVVALVVAVHPAFVQPGPSLLAEALFLPGAAALLLAGFRLLEHPTVATAAVLGGLGGAATLVRSEGIVLALLFALPLLLARPRPAAGRLGLLAVTVACSLVLPAAWAARNLTTFDEPVLLSNNIGSVLSGANCDATYEGDLAGFWLIGDECFPGFRDDDLRTVDESVVAVRLRDDGIDHARAHVGDLPRVAVIRVLRTFQLWEPEQQARLATFEGRRLLAERIGGWVTWASLLLAPAGAAWLWRRDRRTELWLLVAPILVVVAVAAATYGNSRFRVAAEPSLLLLGALAVADLVTNGRARVGRRSPIA